MKENKRLLGVADSDVPVARQLARGLTLVPCWGISEDGRTIPCCKWVRRKDA